jgi:hypothetical protein
MNGLDIPACQEGRLLRGRGEVQGSSSRILEPRMGVFGAEGSLRLTVGM